MVANTVVAEVGAGCGHDARCDKVQRSHFGMREGRAMVESGAVAQVGAGLGHEMLCDYFQCGHVDMC